MSRHPECLEINGCPVKEYTTDSQRNLALTYSDLPNTSNKQKAQHQKLIFSEKKI